jgi:hypothetical protein
MQRAQRHRSRLSRSLQAPDECRPTYKVVPSFFPAAPGVGETMTTIDGKLAALVGPRGFHRPCIKPFTKITGWPCLLASLPSLLLNIIVADLGWAQPCDGEACPAGKHCVIPPLASRAIVSRTCHYPVQSLSIGKTQDSRTGRLRIHTRRCRLHWLSQHQATQSQSGPGLIPLSAGGHSCLISRPLSAPRTVS